MIGAACNTLIGLGCNHFRVDHSKDAFVSGPVHINGIEEFWGMADLMPAKPKGLPKYIFYLHTKETEWRHDHRSKILLSQCRKQLLCYA